MIRDIWNLPRNTHKYFIENISESKHLKSVIIQKYLTFILSIRNSKKKCLASLAKLACEDKSSTTSQNLDLISRESGIENVLEENPRTVANSLQYCPVPHEEEWRLGFLKELLLLRNGQMEVENDELSQEEINDLITIVATT